VLFSLLFPPIPGNMLSRLQDRTFVDMQDMLPDNMALLWQLDDFKPDPSRPFPLDSTDLQHIRQCRPLNLIHGTRIIIHEALRWEEMGF